MMIQLLLSEIVEPNSISLRGAFYIFQKLQTVRSLPTILNRQLSQIDPFSQTIPFSVITLNGFHC
jgi:hypothetical protein